MAMPEMAGRQAVMKAAAAGLEESRVKRTRHSLEASSPEAGDSHCGVALLAHFDRLSTVVARISVGGKVGELLGGGVLRDEKRSGV